MVTNMAAMEALVNNICWRWYAETVAGGYGWLVAALAAKAAGMLKWRASFAG